MSNYRQAPVLYHSEKKGTGMFYQLPQKLMDCVFNQLNGREGNQIKLMSVLLGTAGDGSFAVSEKYICDRTGMDQSSYNRARRSLIDRGWLKLERGSLLVDINAIRNKSEEMGSSHAEDMLSNQRACCDDMDETCDNSMYNKEKQKINNIKRTNKNTGYGKEPNMILGDNEAGKIPDHVLKKMKELGIDFRRNSEAALEEIVGEKLDFNILFDLITRYQADFAKAKGKPEGYVFGILKQKVKSDYKKEKNRREVQRLQEEFDREENRKRPKINWDYIEDLKVSSEKQEGLDDISDLLDDDDDEDDGLYFSEAPTESVALKELELLEQLTAERAAAEDDDYLW